ncbi:Xre family transcriptional regulator [Novosphingobium sp. PhB165]|uniref:helix-turn-helix domain-containing protein n=1 Tax=Novosphingobium sp. PhB165 TaxID=2485105 RepID=UPI00105353AC|nr:transcriptional regulator [Novosphingobium sp. PhB165]TCM18675.1 Xre family transcriptional regulator [Novosphingobium sp. PhB165]
MPVRPVKNADDHKAALKQIEKLWGAQEGSHDGDLLEVLVTLVEAYERESSPIGPRDPVAAIKAAMAAKGYSRADLAALIGQSRATEILGHKRALTLPMIRKIAEAWAVPPSLLVQEYSLKK